MALNLEKLMNNPDAKIILHMKSEGGGGTIEGFISDDISIGSSADWQSPMDTIGGAVKSIQSLFNLGIGAFNALADGFGLGKMSSSALRAYATTVVDYMGTNKPSFTLPLVFPAFRATEDPRVKILHLLECVYPSVDTDNNKGLFMRAPLGYARGSWSEKGGFSVVVPSTGYVNVQVGRWLRFPYLVVNSVQATFSKETTQSNPPFPLYAQAVVTFTFILTPSFRDVVGWFTGVPFNAPAATDPTEKNKAVQTIIRGPAVEVAQPG